jgi:arabinofuranan 3-O-arabinosyltransferase
MGSLEYQTMGFLFNFDFVFVVLNALFVPLWVSERLYIGVVMAIALWGFVRLMDALDIGTGPFRVIGGVAYALSSMILSRVGWRVTETFGAAMLPWILVPLIRATSVGSVRKAAMRSGIAIALIGGMNASVTLALLPAPLLFLLTRERGPRRAQLLRWWLVSVFLATFWWMVGLYLYGAFTANDLRFTERVADTTLPTSLFNVLRGSADWLISANGAAGVPAASAIATAVIPMFAIAIITALGLAGLASNRMTKHRWLIGVFIIGVATIGGAQTGILANPLASSYAKLLGGPLNAFRNVYKFQALVSLPILIGFTALLTLFASKVGATHGSARRRTLQFVLAGFTVLVIVGSAFPIWKGKLSLPGFSSIPTEWSEARSFLEGDGVTRSLVLPGMKYASWSWGNTQQTPLDWDSDLASAFRSQGPLGGPAELSYLDAASEELARGGGPDLQEYLRRGGFSHVVVANDVLPVESSVPQPDVIADALRLSGLELVAAFGASGFGLSNRHAVEIWRIPGASVVNAYDASTLTWLSGDISTTKNISPQIFGDRPYVLARDSVPESLKPKYWMISDGNQRSVVQFGKNRNNQSYILSDSVNQIDGVSVDSRRYFQDDNQYQTTAEIDGVKSVTASSTGPGPMVSNLPSYQPANVLDGDLTTIWSPNRTSPHSSNPWGVQDPWWSVEFASPTEVGDTTIALAIGGYWRGTPVVARTITDAGSVESELSPTNDPQPLAVARGLTTHFRIELSVKSLNEGGDALGIRSINFGPGDFRTWLHTPSELLDEFADPATAAPAWVFDRLRPATDVFVSLSSESEMRRVFDSPREISEVVTAQGRPRTKRQVTDFLDSTPKLTVSSSMIWGDEPLLAPRNLVDNDPSTVWIGGLLATENSAPEIGLRWNGFRDISSFRISLFDGAARPTRVEVRAGEQSRNVEVGIDGSVSFEPIQADSLTIVLHYEAIDGVAPQGSIGLSALEILSLQDIYPSPIDRSEVIPISCAAGPNLVIGNQALRFSASPTVGDLIDLARVPLTSCGGASVLIQPGSNRLSSDSSSILAVDHIDLATPPLGSAIIPAARSLKIGTWNNDRRTMTIGAGDQNLVVVNEIFNKGARATLAGKQLESVTIDGWRQGFVVPSGPGGEIVLTFGPDRMFRFLTIAGFGFLVLLAAGAFWPSRGRTEPAPIGEGVIEGEWLWAITALAAVWVVGAAVVLLPVAWVLRRLKNWATPVISATAFLCATLLVVTGTDRLAIFYRVGGFEKWAVLFFAAIAFVSVAVNLVAESPGDDDGE